MMFLLWSRHSRLCLWCADRWAGLALFCANVADVWKRWGNAAKERAILVRWR